MCAVGAGGGAGATGASGDDVRPRYCSPASTPQARSASAVNPASPNRNVRFIRYFPLGPASANRLTAS